MWARTVAILMVHSGVIDKAVTTSILQQSLPACAHGSPLSSLPFRHSEQDLIWGGCVFNNTVDSGFATLKADL